MRWPIPERDHEAMLTDLRKQQQRFREYELIVLMFGQWCWPKSLGYAFFVLILTRCSMHVTVHGWFCQRLNVENVRRNVKKLVYYRCCKCSFRKYFPNHKLHVYYDSENICRIYICKTWYTSNGLRMGSRYQFGCYSSFYGCINECMIQYACINLWLLISCNTLSYNLLRWRTCHQIIILYGRYCWHLRIMQ